MTDIHEHSLNFKPTDIDECADLQFNITCPENAHCNNTPGTYNCVCNEGYKHDSNTCRGARLMECNIHMHSIISNCIHADVNECTTGEHNCNLNADCINSIGNFSCRCRVGYNGDGVNCCKGTIGTLLK